MNLYELHEWVKTLEDANRELLDTQLELNEIFDRLKKTNEKLRTDRDLVKSLLFTAQRLFGNQEKKDE